MHQATAPNSAALAKTSVEIENSTSSVSVSKATNAGTPSEPSKRRITRYAMSGIGKTRKRFGWFSCPVMYVQNP